MKVLIVVLASLMTACAYEASSDPAPPSQAADATEAPQTGTSQADGGTCGGFEFACLCLGKFPGDEHLGGLVTPKPFAIDDPTALRARDACFAYCDSGKAIPYPGCGDPSTWTGTGE